MAYAIVDLSHVLRMGLLLSEACELIRDTQGELTGARKTLLFNAAGRFAELLPSLGVKDFEVLSEHLLNSIRKPNYHGSEEKAQAIARNPTREGSEGEGTEPQGSSQVCNEVGSQRLAEKFHAAKAASFAESRRREEAESESEQAESVRREIETESESEGYEVHEVPESFTQKIVREADEARSTIYRLAEEIEELAEGPPIWETKTLYRIEDAAREIKRKSSSLSEIARCIRKVAQSSQTATQSEGEGRALD